MVIFLLNLGCAQRSLRDFDTFLRLRISLDEGDIQKLIKQYISHFTTYEVSPGIFQLKTFLKFFSRGFQNEFQIRGRIRPNVIYNQPNSIIVECDKITMRTKLLVRGDIPALRFDQNLFFSSILGLASGCDFRRDYEYFGEKIINLSTIDEIHKKCDVFDDFVLSGIRESTLFSFVSNKLAGYKVFCQPETIHYKKIDLFS